MPILNRPGFEEFSPTCMDYSRYLDIVTSLLRITRDETRDRYGSYTYGQWEALFEQYRQAKQKNKEKA